MFRLQFLCFVVSLVIAAIIYFERNHAAIRSQLEADGRWDGNIPRLFDFCYHGFIQAARIGREPSGRLLKIR